jgi:hypothetical protein
MPLIVVENVACAPSQTQVTIGSFMNMIIWTLCQKEWSHA